MCFGGDQNKNVGLSVGRSVGRSFTPDCGSVPVRGAGREAGCDFWLLFGDIVRCQFLDHFEALDGMKSAS